MDPLTNDTAGLKPVTSFDGPVLDFDFPAVSVGIAEYEEGPTGCTVFHFQPAGSLAVDVRGGNAGFMGEYRLVDAICLAGGSLYGLEAVTGVQAEWLAMNGYLSPFRDVATVSGGIIFDFGPRDNGIYPDKELGRVALRTARPGVFPLGPRGAGRSATVGKCFDFWEGESAGQGGAFGEVGGTKIAAFSVVNALGAIVDRQGNVVRGNLDPGTGARHPYLDGIQRELHAGGAMETPSGNTTLTVVVTNQKVDERQLRQVGREVHGSMWRAIQPFNGMSDGDVLWMVSTNEVENARIDATALGALAAEVVWDAVLASFVA